MTALDVRNALIQVLTATTVDGTVDNPVAATFTQVPDQIAFDNTPALIVPPQMRSMKPHTIGRDHHKYEEELTLEVEYLDSPLVDDNQLERLAQVETWIEQAIANLLANPGGIVNGTDKSWQFLVRLSTRISPPL